MITRCLSPAQPGYFAARWVIPSQWLHTQSPHPAHFLPGNAAGGDSAHHDQFPYRKIKIYACILRNNSHRFAVSLGGSFANPRRPGRPPLGRLQSTAIQRSKLDFTAPFGPISAVKAPLGIVKCSPSRAVKAPNSIERSHTFNLTPN